MKMLVKLNVFLVHLVVLLVCLLTYVCLVLMRIEKLIILMDHVNVNVDMEKTAEEILNAINATITKINVLDNVLKTPNLMAKQVYVKKLNTNMRIICNLFIRLEE